MSDLQRMKPGGLSVTPDRVDEFMGAYKHQLRRRVKSENTLIAYESDWRHFKKWCKSMNLQPVPADEFTVIAYLNYWGMNPDPSISLKASTLRRRIAAIKFYNNDEGYSVLDYGQHNEDPIQDTLEMISRTQKAGVRKAKPISQQLLVHMIDAQSKDLRGLRNSALLLVGFMGAMRRSEITSLQVGDLDFRELGVAVTISSSKTDQQGLGQTVYIPRTRNADTCALRVVKKWIGEAGISDGYLFRQVNKHGTVNDSGLTDQFINTLVRDTLVQLDIDPEPYSAHSLRSGFATSAAEAGADIRMIMKQTRHARFETAEGYIQDGAGFKNNAVSLFSDL